MSLRSIISKALGFDFRHAKRVCFHTDNLESISEGKRSYSHYLSSDSSWKNESDL